MSPSPQDLHALGWSLLHFVWQGAGCALLLASVDVVLRRAAPQTRYLAACATLLVMLGVPIVTFRLVRGSGASADAVASAGTSGGESLGSVPSSTIPADLPLIRAVALRERVEPWLPALVGLWGAGVVLLSLRGFGGWTVVQRLRRSGLTPVPAVEETLARLIAALRVSAPVRLYESALVQVPTVVGWLRPVILLPASALTGLSPEQLELILAHELAHVRRQDYLVNLFQTAAETLLFYHPAVWWVSHRMRVEREHCCDDLAAGAAGNPVRYARALADLEELCFHQGTRRPALAMAATNGSLFTRIARLLGPPHHLPRTSRGLASLLALASLCLAFGLGSSLVSVPSALVAASPALFASTQDREEPSSPAPKQAAKPKARPVAESKPSPEGRAFPIERVIEMARAGITPEYIDEMDALGYSSLSAEQLVALRGSGVGPDFVREMGDAGFPKLSADQLLTLRGQGVSGQFVSELRAQGLAGLSLSDLVELRAQGVSGEFVAELKQAGYDGISVSRLIALRSQGVTGRYVAELKALGYDKLSLIKLIGLRSQGITREYVQGMADLGYRGLEVPMLLGLRNQGVTPEFVRALKEAGYEGLPPGLLIELGSHGVNADFIRGLKASGLANLKPEGLIELRDHGVTPDFIRGLKEGGYDGLAAGALLALRDHGVTPEFIRGLREGGYQGLAADTLIALRDHGVTPEFVQEMNGAGLEKLKPEELIELRDQGVRGALLKRLRGRQ